MRNLYRHSLDWLDHRLSRPHRRLPRLTRTNMHEHAGDALRIHTYPYAAQETIVYAEPHRVGALPQPYQDQSGTVTYPAPFVLEITGGTIRGRHGGVFTRDERLVFESFMHQERFINRTSLGRVYYREALPDIARHLIATPHFEVICPLIHVYSRTYFHWAVEALARVELLLQYQAATQRRVPVLINRHPPQWMTDSLHLMGVSDFVEWDATYATADTLIVPMAQYSEITPSREAARRISHRLRAALPPATRPLNAPRIYISRQRAKRRRVINEDEIMALLEPQGFQLFELETLSFAEQVRLFAQAEYVIGAHGSGFVNLIHSDNAKMIEFFEPSYIRLCFYRSACALGFDYGFIVGTPQDKDIRVDVRELERLMAQMGD